MAGQAGCGWSRAHAFWFIQRLQGGAGDEVRPMILATGGHGDAETEGQGPGARGGTCHFAHWVSLLGITGPVLERNPISLVHTLPR